MLDTKLIKQATNALEKLIDHLAEEAGRIALEDIKTGLEEDLFEIVFDELPTGKLSLSKKVAEEVKELSELLTNIAGVNNALYEMEQSLKNKANIEQENVAAEQSKVDLLRDSGLDSCFDSDDDLPF